MLHKRVLLVSCAIVAAAFPVAAQAPLTADSLKGALSQATTMSRQLDSLRRVDDTLQARAAALIHDFNDHNKEPCEYPQGQPELCANFDTERFMLNNRSADLQKEMKASAARRRALLDDFTVLMTRLKTDSWSPAIAQWKDQIVACTRVNIVREAVACLARAQVRH